MLDASYNTLQSLSATLRSSLTTPVVGTIAPVARPPPGPPPGHKPNKKKRGRGDEAVDVDAGAGQAAIHTHRLACMRHHHESSADLLSLEWSVNGFPCCVHGSHHNGRRS